MVKNKRPSGFWIRRDERRYNIKIPQKNSQEVGEVNFWFPAPTGSSQSSLTPVPER